MEFWFSELHTGNVKLSIKIEKQLFSGESEYQRIDVFDSEEFGKFIALDGEIVFSEKDEFIYDEMVTHVPMAVHPCVKDVLIIGGGDGGIRVGGLPVLFKAKGGGGDFKLDAGLHGAGSSGQECFQRGDAFRALRADKDAAKLKMGFAFHTGLMPLPAADTGDDEHQ